MLYYDFDNDFGVFLIIIKKKLDIYVLLFIYYIVIIIGNL